MTNQDLAEKLAPELAPDLLREPIIVRAFADFPSSEAWRANYSADDIAWGSDPDLIAVYEGDWGGPMFMLVVMDKQHRTLLGYGKSRELQKLLDMMPPQEEPSPGQ